MARKLPVALYVISALVIFVCFIAWRHDHDRIITAGTTAFHKVDTGSRTNGHATSKAETAEALKDGAIMGKLGNETLKAELGRAAWKVLHTTMAQFPDKPSADDSQALKDYIHLFARLYPCGECAAHFQQILKKYPPQVASRNSAAAWACFVHNQVNESKGKPIFDCANIGDFYDCGCADDEKDALAHAGEHSEKIAAGHEPVQIHKEGPSRGG